MGVVESSVVVVQAVLVVQWALVVEHSGDCHQVVVQVVLVDLHQPPPPKSGLKASVSSSESSSSSWSSSAAFSELETLKFDLGGCLFLNSGFEGGRLVCLETGSWSAGRGCSSWIKKCSNLIPNLACMAIR